MKPLRIWLSCVAGLLGAALAVSHCLVESVCYNDADCPGGHYCDKTAGKCRYKCLDHAYCPAGSHCDIITGSCVENECETDADCDPAFLCREWQCVSREPIQCPEDMVGVENRFCIDVYEASRPDATAASQGSDDSMATSRAGVMPWMVDTPEMARQACQAAGKDLCTEAQWVRTCRGPDQTSYSYGNDYHPTTCNGIDKFCSCAPESPCAGHDPCPYPKCYYDCQQQTFYHLEPTGTGPGCTNGYGVYDINGNLWEFVLHGAEILPRGGAYNCLDSARLHRCDFVPTFLPLALGFRCCSPGSTE